MPDIKLIDIPEQTPSSEIDEEIIEIFVEEVEEVLEEIVSNFNTWKNDPTDSESLITLRRAFHTLKGSGRLVGATTIGELGWRFENMLNRLIDGRLSLHDDLLTILEQVEKVLPSLVEQFQRNQPPHYEVVLLISQADYLAQGNDRRLSEFKEFEAAGGTMTPQTLVAKPEHSPEPPEKPPDDKANLLGENKLKKTEVHSNSSPDVSYQNKQEPEVENLDVNLRAESLSLGHEPDGGAVCLPKGELEQGAETLSELLGSEPEQEAEGFPELPDEPDDELPDGELVLDAYALPDLLDGELPEEIDIEALPDLPDGELPEEIDIEALPDLPDGELPELDVEAFPDLPDSEQELDVEALPDLPDSEPELGTVTVESTPLDDIKLETAPLATSDKQIISVTDTTPSTEDDEAIDPKLFDIFKKEASEHLFDLKNYFEKLEKQSPAQINQEIVRAFHTLNGSSRSVEFLAVSEIAAPMEGYGRALFERKTELTPDMLAFFNEATHFIEDLLNGKAIDEEQQQTLLDHVQMSLESLPSLPPPKKTPPKPPPTSKASEEIPDATDEFMAIFLEEAEEIIENTQSLLERWQAAPKNMQLMKELQRELHTLKGGARMVGIAPMGDLSHQMESVLTRIVEGTAQSNTQLQEITQKCVDELAAMLEAVRSGVPLEMPEDLIEQINAAMGPEEEEAEAPLVNLNKPATPESTIKIEEEQASNGIDQPIEKDPIESAEDRIRVRATLIDKLTNLVGELSISRAHMEQQQGAIKNNLLEMEQTVIRLRDQLRRLGIETEAQIISHFSGSKEPDADDEFDPLELDRFSTMQQLSRSLMESVGDLMEIQEFLKTLTRQSDSLLVQQTRIGAQLQENIMRTRMIPFSRISPRLQRIARLTARELHKQVKLVINGENTEFERTVLNRIVAPHEHLLRNAIKHGIEDAPTRQQAGKSSKGKITIDLSREGTELIIKLSDDGGGLDLPAIRKKAEEQGFIKPNTVVSDHELMQLILESGFSTAKTVDQVAGRGVGMDVVNTEIKQLSGHLRIDSKTGEGTVFEIRLPLSLTINQALLVRVGEETMAVPMNNVEAVMRVPRAEVLSEQPDEVRYYKYMDNNYRIFHLGELIGFGKTASAESPLIPTLFVRAGNRRVALLVDGIEGSKEIVVKSVGPQMSAIRWIAGATILGDGRVVLILDVPTLTRADTTPQYVPSQVTETAKEEKQTANTIMVVDDSITVRKVTARLLKRQGMDVLTAKDGLDAVSILQEHIPDLMLLDVEMPRMDGYELATLVRNNSDWKHLPIIMITSRTGAKHRDKAEKIGINRYLGKPFNETELLENINALLAE
jgi:chemosensory pili system protein ChpA (sensor histidine kinase/response regulator)